MPQVGFEPAIVVFERAMTFRALDRAATVVGCSLVLQPSNHLKYLISFSFMPNRASAEHKCWYKSIYNVILNYCRDFRGL
jgi:hypothetical protein